MDNQHRRIKGYRELSAEEIALMNEIKEEGARLEALLMKVSGHVIHQSKNPAALPTEELERLAAAEPHRWVAMARTSLQVGMMELVRAVAQPGSF